LFNELNLLTDKPPVKDKALSGGPEGAEGDRGDDGQRPGDLRGDPAECCLTARSQVLAGASTKLVESRTLLERGPAPQDARGFRRRPIAFAPSPC
jgi:hypothetical protein